MPEFVEERKLHAFSWVADPLADHPSYFEKSMFGCLACYYRGRMVLVLAAKEKPWRGVLIPTDRAHHASLREDFPDLEIHPVLGKWLYLPEASEVFEEASSLLVESLVRGDERLGVEPQEKVRRVKSAGRSKGRVAAKSARRKGTGAASRKRSLRGAKRP